MGADYISIDLDRVLRQRAPGLRRRMPGVAVRALERLICQDELNRMLRINAGRRDADFCRGVMEDLDVSMTVDGQVPDPSVRRVIVACNHPLGALDGIAMIDWASRHWGGQVHFVVNDLLMAVEPLRGVFVPVNHHGRQNRGDVSALDRAMAGGDPVIVFPAGLVSRMGKGGRVADLPWHKMFVAKAVEHNRDVVPARFHGRNSMSFYRWASWRRRLGIGLNLEMALLPREVFRSRHARYGLTLAEAVPHQRLAEMSQAQAVLAVREASEALGRKKEREGKNHTFHISP